MAKSTTADDDDVEPWRFINRRQIYFYRLVGDDSFSQKSSGARDSIFRAVIALCYALFFAFIAIYRGSVSHRFEANNGVKGSLSNTAFRVGPSPEYFAQIKTQDHFYEWITRVLLFQALEGLPRSKEFSIGSYNQIIPLFSDSKKPTIRITARRVKLVKTDVEDTQDLWPDAWNTFKLQLNSNNVDTELTQNLVDFYPHDGSDRTSVWMSPYIGFLGGSDKASGTNVASWSSLAVGTPVGVQWEYADKGGYLDQGGYQGIIELGFTSNMALIKQSNVQAGGVLDYQQMLNNVVLEQPFSLLSKKGAQEYAEQQNQQTGQGPRPEISQTVSFGRFGQSTNLLGPETGTIAVDFITYNPKLNTISYVQIYFVWTGAGFLDGKEVRVDSVILDEPAGLFAILEPLFLLCALTFSWLFIFKLYNLYKGNSLRTFIQCTVYDAWTWVEIFGMVFAFLSASVWIGLEEKRNKTCKTINTCETLRSNTLQFSTNFQSAQAHPNISIANIQELLDAYRNYDRIAAITCFLLFIRVIPELTRSVARVELLDYTIRLATAPILRYLAFTIAVFFAFCAFAAVGFSYASFHFDEIGKTCLTLFFLFLGAQGPIKELQQKDHPSVTWFWLPFMLFFALINMQMFNAMINQAYNRASVELASKFEQEKLLLAQKKYKANPIFRIIKKTLRTIERFVFQARKGAKQSRKIGGKGVKVTGKIAMSAGNVALDAEKAIMASTSLGASNQANQANHDHAQQQASNSVGGQTNSGMKKRNVTTVSVAVGGSASDSGGGGGGDGPGGTDLTGKDLQGQDNSDVIGGNVRAVYDHQKLDNLDPDIKDKVQEYLNEGDDSKQVDGPTTILLYLLFAVSYVLFLHSFVRVNVAFNLNESVKLALNHARFSTTDWFGATFYRSLSDIEDRQDLQQWLSNGLPVVIFSNTGLSQNFNPTISQEILNHAEIVSSPAEESVFRSNRLVPNFGSNNPSDNVLCLSNWNCLLKGGFALGRIRIYETNRRGTSYNDAAIRDDPTSLFGIQQQAILGGSSYECDGFNSPINQGPNFCCWKRIEMPARWSFDRDIDPIGHFDCLLLSDRNLFLNQLSTFAVQDLIQVDTTQLELHLGLYNPHSNTVIYSETTFELTEGGRASFRIKNTSFSLFQVENLRGQLAVVFGAIYISLVLYFGNVELQNLKIEAQQKWISARKTFVQVLLEHYSDAYNLLDLSSICISLSAMVLYFNFTLRVLDFETKFEKLDQELAPTNPNFTANGFDSTYPDFSNFLQELSAAAYLYNRVSAVNTMVIALRTLKFFRDSPRMNRLYQTVGQSALDIFWFLIMFFMIFLGFVFLAHRSFGTQIMNLSEILPSFYYCFDFIIGNFEYWSLYQVDPLMGPIFVFPKVTIFNFLLLNIFFAILDRVFITVVMEGSEPPAINFKRKLKPYLGGLLPFIEWDEDIEMQPNPEGALKKAPQSRKKVSEETKLQVERILLPIKGALSGANLGGGGGNQGKQQDELDAMLGPGHGSSGKGKSQGLTDVLPSNMMDGRLDEIFQWSRSTVKKFVHQYRSKFLDDSLAGRISSMLKGSGGTQHAAIHENLTKDIELEKKAASDFERQVRYANEVFITSALQDQTTLAKYVHILHQNLYYLEHKRTNLRKAVHHLENFDVNSRSGSLNEGSSTALVQKSEEDLEREEEEKKRLKEEKAQALVEKLQNLQAKADAEAEEEDNKSRTGSDHKDDGLLDAAVAQEPHHKKVAKQDLTEMLVKFGRTIN